MSLYIISILAAILFPVFGRARENARRSSCQSNLKQLGLGIAQYLQHYDEMYLIGNFTFPTLTVSNGDYASGSARNNTEGCGNNSSCSGSAALADIGVTPGGAQRHLQGGNYLFVDGHVKWYTANSDIQSPVIYNSKTPFEGSGVVSGQNPTFALN